MYQAGSIAVAVIAVSSKTFDEVFFFLYFILENSYSLTALCITSFVNSFIVITIFLFHPIVFVSAQITLSGISERSEQKAVWC